jgi:xanthine dehydrogenase YagR molybdenum-binding subunit
MKLYESYFDPDAPATSGTPANAEPKPWAETKVVGKRIPRIDAREKVMGQTVYTRDMEFSDMLHAVILRCPHAHAKVKSVDASKTQSMKGVRAVLTPSSPGAKMPWYFGPKGPTSQILDTHCRYAGDEVAAVAAETLEQAMAAVRAIKVEYEVLPFVTDCEAALKAGAPVVHEGGNTSEKPNVYKRGDIAKGFAEAEFVVEKSFRTPCVIHSPLETHVSIAQWEGNRLTVWDSSQGVFPEREYLSRAFGLPMSSVRVICKHMGGGFGSKLDLSKHTVIAGLLAKTTKRPVKIALSREEQFLCVGNRPAAVITMKAGVKKDGTITALQLKNVATAGAYPGDSGIAYLVMDLYQCANVQTEETNAYTNAGQARAFRAPGFPQCAWALEQVMDALAEGIGMDPVEFRVKNTPKVSQLRGGMPFTSTGLAECLTEGAKTFGWTEARRRPRGTGSAVRGVGMAACMWAWQGGPPATAIVKLFADGSVNLNIGASDLGTGTKTVMAMVVAEELGVAIDKISIEWADTGTTQYAPLSGGSQTVVSVAPAVREAALNVKKQLLEYAVADLKKKPEELSLRDGKVVVTAEPDKSVALHEVKMLGQQQDIIGVGHRGPNPASKIPLPFGAQFAEVEVNKRTGEVKVLRMLAAHDSGRVMSPLTYQNQVFGGMIQGLGLALTEQRVIDDNQTGKVLNQNWHDYKMPTAKDVPFDLTCLPIDPHDTECNNTGSKGLGEPATIPTAAAIANAIYNATGVRVTTAPVTPAQMLLALAEKPPAPAIDKKRGGK